MNEERTIRVLRSMAWERAKAELKAMLATYYSEMDGNKYALMRSKTDAFIDSVESNGLDE